MKCPFCAEDIKDNAKKCKHCGEWLDANKTEKASVKQQPPPIESFKSPPSPVQRNYGNSSNTYSSLKGLSKKISKAILYISIGFVIFVLVIWFIIIIGNQFEGSSKIKNITAKNYHLFAPSDQIAFYDLNAKYKDIYGKGQNEIQKSETYNKLTAERTAYINKIQYKINNWVGKISITTTRGAPDVSIDVEAKISGVEIKYSNKYLFENLTEKAGSPVYNQLKNIPSGSYVRFSGEFTKAEERTLFTEIGSVLLPEFSVKFHDIQILTANN